MERDTTKMSLISIKHYGMRKDSNNTNNKHKNYWHTYITRIYYR